MGNSLERTISSSWLKGLCDMFTAEGLDAEALLRHCGLSYGDLTDQERRFPAGVTTRLWELAVAASPNAELGLKRELCDRYGGLHMVGYAMVACPNLHEGLKLLQRFLAVVSEAATFSLEPDPQGLWLNLGLAGESIPAIRQRVEFGMLTLLMLCSWLARSDIVPLSVQFHFPPPSNPQPFTTAFLREVEFNADKNRMLISNAVLYQELPTHNPVVASMHEQLLEQHMRQLGHTSTRYRVFTEIVRRLKNGEPKRADIAASLFISDRTLQRRLQEENSNFLEVLNQARRELAEQYLADSRLSITEVAELLGFLDKSNFQRACKRWFGHTPGQYRAKLKLN